VFVGGEGGRELRVQQKFKKSKQAYTKEKLEEVSNEIPHSKVGLH
jgi:hypothetical protein